MRPPIVICAGLLALEVEELGDEAAALHFLADAGFETREVAPIIDVACSLARDLRAEQADSLSAEVHDAG
jgi:hypothetical protein